MSVLAERSAAVGVQTPRIMSAPVGGDYTLADRAIGWLEDVVGLVLDEWQRMVLRESLAEREPGKWAASEVGLIVPRQNGKDVILEGRELVGMFLLREPLLIHSAHQFKTAQEHFLRLRDRIENVPELVRRLRGGTVRDGFRTAAGEQGIFLATGARLRILARKGGSGRGFSAPYVAFNEAMDLPEATVGDMIPTQSAQPNPQRWYTGSSVDEMIHENGVVFARVRERGIRGGDPRLAFFEWSLDDDEPGSSDPEDMLDDDAVAAANPGYGIRISRHAVEDEFNALAARTFDVERRGRGAWPPTEEHAKQVIDLDAWNELASRDSLLTDPVCLAVDTTPDRSWSSVAAAGLNEDGTPHVEIVEHSRGTKWVAARVAELVERHDAVVNIGTPEKPRMVPGVVCGGKSGAASLEPELRDLDIELKLLSTSDEARAFGLTLDLVAHDRLRHLGSEELRSAVKGATKRPAGDAWAWDRRDAAVDISPLVAASLALWESAENGWDGDWSPQVW